MSDLFAEHKQDLPDEWHSTFDALTAQGKSPTGIKATIEYVTTEKSQSDVADEYNTSAVTIRNLQTAVVALGPVEGVIGTSRSELTTMQLCRYLADYFGWEEGREFTVSKAYKDSTPQPSLNKRGWKSIYKEIVENEQ